MSTRAPLSVRDFADFFETLHGVRPFPWQRRLLEELVRNPASNGQAWPDCMALPTASGKTACIDIALFHLALEADRPPSTRNAPRRVFFCVDRRVIVDEAHERAKEVAGKLRDARDGVLRTVANRLRVLAADDPQSLQRSDPLAVHQLRGGMYRDDAWATSPVQPTIVCTTVDQLGSRLLFRGYGVSPRSASIHAGLVANDSLILLDEAHCAEPFRQTLDAVRLFRGDRWAEQPLRSPFAFVEMSATPRSDGRRFELDQGDRSPKHLGPRLSTPKPARLIETRHKTASEGFAQECAKLAQGFADEGSRRIAIMVNRVDTAKKVFARLKAREADPVDPSHLTLPVKALMIGRMRPLDRDDLVRRWQPYLRAGKGRRERTGPLLIVATQCLEVGANLDFDAMITECASLDALRQRFGRLNRLGQDRHTRAAIVASTEALKDSEDDPIYGTALHATWAWLTKNVQGGKKDPRMDMCADAVAGHLPKNEKKRAELLRTLSAPASDSPVMLPAHIDLWCQTCPAPDPDPDVNLFLHGSDWGVPAVSVCWRADMGDDPNMWLDIVALLPPSSPECMPAPLWLVRRWLSQKETGRDPGDVEYGADSGAQEAGESAEESPPDAGSDRWVFVWRGSNRNESKPTQNPMELRPGDAVVIPAALAMTCDFGHLPDAEDGIVVDRAEQANLVARRRGALRLRADLLARWFGNLAVPLIELLDRWQYEDPPPEDLVALRQHFRAAARCCPKGDPRASPDRARSFIAEALAALSPPQFRKALRRHPGGGCTAVVPGRLIFADAAADEESDFSDEGDESSDAAGPVTLRAHTDQVAALAARYAKASGLPESCARAVRAAAQLHDYGKIDPRFQTILGASRLRAFAAEPLAKSFGVIADAAVGGAGPPDGFRHEMLSMQIADRRPALLHAVPEEARDLVLHLIASHHGHARPLAPVVIDLAPPSLPGWRDGFTGVPPQERAEWEGLPAHRLDSGVSDRFWTLTRRYGWWGLAYLEAILRFADRAVSRAEQEGPR